MYTVEQLTAAQKKQAATMIELSQKAFTGVEKLIELNLRTARAALEEAADADFGATDAQQFLAKVDPQPAADKAAAYGREVYEIVSEAQGEFAQYAEDGVAQMRAQWMALVDNAVKNAPAGSETAASMFKSSVVAANDAFDTAQRMSKQVAEGLQGNLVSLTPKATAKAKPAAKAKR